MALITTISETIRAYQAQLEHYRAARARDLDDKFLSELSEDLQKARRDMEIVWLERQ